MFRLSIIYFNKIFKLVHLQIDLHLLALTLSKLLVNNKAISHFFFGDDGSKH